MKCPRCRLEVPDGEIRCPRCLENLMQCKNCSGNCLLCLTEDQKESETKKK